MLANSEDGETNPLLAVKRSSNASQLIDKCPIEVRQAIQRREGGSVTKVVTIENLLGGQLTITH